MKDGLLCGVAVGMFLGALLIKKSPCANKVWNEGEKIIVDEFKK